MKAYTLKVGYTFVGEQKIDELNWDIINRVATSYGGILKEEKVKAFKIPCCADCGDPSCGNNIECNLLEYHYFSEEDTTPDNLDRVHAAMTLFEPVVGAQTINPDDPTDIRYWNRFDPDDSGDEPMMETKKGDLN